MSRKPNARVHLLKLLRGAKTATSALINRWTVPAYVYEHYPVTAVDHVTGTEYQTTAARRVKRPADQYPENMASAWAALYTQATEQAELWAQIRDTAMAEYRDTLARQQQG